MRGMMGKVIDSSKRGHSSMIDIWAAEASRGLNVSCGKSFCSGIYECDEEISWEKNDC